MKIIEVDWVDSNGFSGWDRTDRRKEDTLKDTMLCKSVGYLLDRKPDRIILTQSQSFYTDAENANSVDSTLIIPTVAVKKIRILKK